MTLTEEHSRLLAHRERRATWRNWGPYLSERAWGTVREDYSPDGQAWDYFPHDHARSKAYRWGEDGIGGFCDRHQHLCLAFALWNERDPILKERYFGLTGNQGNHGEDVKEVYYYLDGTPTHSYMKMLYKYPQREYPYAQLLEGNNQRSRFEWEYELLDTGIFDEDRYFDITIEYAKAGENDILCRITIVNRGPDAAPVHVLPTLWFRNTWSWGYEKGPQGNSPDRPVLYRLSRAPDGLLAIRTEHETFGSYTFYADAGPESLFTENDTNTERLYGIGNSNPYVKDAFHRYLVERDYDATNPAQSGTKAAAHYRYDLEAGEQVIIRLRLSDIAKDGPFADFDAIFAQRQGEADTFYASIQNPQLTDEDRSIQRQALAGMLWTKQLYYLDMEQWLDGDPVLPVSRRFARNANWEHLTNFDVISMPDKWEYPWYATWDTAFHCLPLVMIDPDYAKRQLVLVTREWYMHPNGQLPAYEWAFDDVNPPVHAWAVWRIFQIDAERTGQPDYEFLEGQFHKLLLNFTWWVNRKDEDDNNIFQGGFLGLDNISLFDRSAELPTGGHIDQADGTAWMAFFCIEMMRISLELARRNPVYEDTATKFFEHYLRIATAMTNCDGRQAYSLWNEEDGFFYDVLHLPGNHIEPLRVRSMVGLLPLIAVEPLEPEILSELPVFDRRIHWFLHNRQHLTGNIVSIDTVGQRERRLLSLLTETRLRRVLRYLLDEEEFLSPHGIRSLSKIHEHQPYSFHINGDTYTVRYLPAESDNGLFGGNSNWRGPIWFPVNFLIIEALEKLYHYYGDAFTVEYPTGSGTLLTLDAIAADIARRLIGLFQQGTHGRRPAYGGVEKMQHDPHWRDYILFYEYFNGDNGAGLGASHQTGWTGLVANLIQRYGVPES